MRHLIGIPVVALALILAAIAPFLPGHPDAVAMPISMVAYLASFLGLLLVPAGVLLMLAHRSTRPSPRLRSSAATFAFVLTGAAAALSVVAALAASRVLAAALLAPLALGMFRLWKAVRSVGSTPPHALPLYFIAIPIVVVVALRLLATPLNTFARDRAIENAAPLIAEIERYRVRRGEYPISLVALHPDINTGIIGIPIYGYERAGAAYNLFFEAPVFRFGTQEIVVYNPLDEHVMTSHRLDVLQLSPEALALDRSRGHYAVHAARQPHWKYYWFD